MFYLDCTQVYRREGWIGPWRTDQRQSQKTLQNGPESQKRTSGSQERTSAKKSSSLFTHVAMKAYEDIFESSSSLLSNASSLISFGRRKSRVMLGLVKTAQKINSLSWQNVGTTCHAKLYQSTTFRGAWHTLLERSWSLVSHPRNGSSFGLPNKKLWSLYWKLLWRPTVTRN